MLANDVTICQEALAVIRQDVELSATTYTSPSTKAEKACLRCFDSTRKSFLALHDWNFARASATFSTTKPACIRVVDVVDADGVSVRWKLSGSTIDADPGTGGKTVYTQDVTDVTTWPPHARAAFTLALACELSILITGRTADLESTHALYQEKLAAARLADLTEGDPADDDAHEVLALVRNRVDLDPAKLATTIEYCNRRLGMFKASAAAEVIASHNWTLPTGVSAMDYANLPPLAKAAVLVLAAQKIAAHVGAGADASASLAQLYELKLQKARIKDLADNPSSDDLVKEVLATIQCNYNLKDDALPFDVAAFTDRIDAVKDTVRGTLLAYHHWSFARKTAAYSSAVPNDCVRVLRVVDSDGAKVEWSRAGSTLTASTDAASVVYTGDVALSSWPKVARAAYVAAVAAEIVQATVPDPAAAASVKKALDALASERIRAARVADLNEDGGGSSLVREVKAVLKSEARITDADLDESADALEERVLDLLPSARAEILSAHAWNFARRTEPVASNPVEGGRFAFSRPRDCVRVTGVRGPGGDLSEWTLQGGLVVARGPVTSVTYIREEEEVEYWPPLVRRALVYRLAADAATTIPRRDKDETTLLALYERKLAAAALTDAREGNPGRSAWGRSRFVDSITGRPGVARDGRHGTYHR